MKNSLCLICFVLINIISLKAQTLRNKVALDGNWRFITDSTNAVQVKPGETFIFTLNDMNARAGFDIYTPAGYR